MQEATAALLGTSVAQKNELLFTYGINFNNLPNWQRRGAGLYWETYDKHATNPQTGEEIYAKRRRIRRELDLPMGDAYEAFITYLLGIPSQP